MDNQAANTDREIYREPDAGHGSFYSDSIHVTKEGGIGINCGGTVVVMSLQDWFGAGDCSGWNPMETAPKDQDVIVTNGVAVGEARFFPDEDGWWWAGSNPTDYQANRVWEPKYWMPLPKPPSIDGELRDAAEKTAER